MEVHVVADDPVRAAIDAALSDIDITTRDAEPTALSDARFAIVSDVIGSDTFEQALDTTRAGETPWIAVEIGGVGGHPIADVDAAVSGFAPATACYNCLRQRVASTRASDEPVEQPSADRSAARLAGAIAGRECVRTFSGDAESIVGRVRELPYASRRCLPVPTCECESDGRNRTLDLTDEESLELEQAVERAELAIDSRLGPVHSIGEAESFPAPYYLATLADTDPFSDASASKQSAGVDDDWNAALMKAVGEGLERYCAGVYRDAAFRHASVDDLENPVSPLALVRPEDAPAFDSSTTCRWVDGVDLESGESAQLPAAAVHFPQPGDPLVPSITTGLGLGSSTADAVRSGLTEVIERDATMLSWYSTYEPIGLAVEDEAYDRLERRAHSEGLTATALLVTQDVDVPVVAVAVYREGAESDGDDRWPRFAAGSAAALDGTAAARSALAEALQNWMELRGIGRDEADTATGQIGHYASFPDPVKEFVDVERTIPADRVGPDPAPTGTDALEELVSRTNAAGLRPYAARVTTRDIEALGFEAVRVVVPGAQPLFTNEPYFGDRATDVPDELGFEPNLEREFHPYP
ncbi:bacteriocin biosynthesis protein SagD [Halostagnicola sp. A56]|uniref:YcaO-like family protein n=1 Tax=Halostagnicola sp. A56 TaxID=1495067 RepID=UPI0004A11678|nr:YcaO-like family protein [Halostagnicola sp. A56]KDE58774.1 bacteriocin biosynthesis protein SagD [Halostagnicola sp. A56]